MMWRTFRLTIHRPDGATSKACSFLQLSPGFEQNVVDIPHIFRVAERTTDRPYEAFLVPSGPNRPSWMPHATEGLLFALKPREAHEFMEGFDWFGLLGWVLLDYDIEPALGDCLFAHAFILHDMYPKQSLALVKLENRVQCSE